MSFSRIILIYAIFVVGSAVPAIAIEVWVSILPQKYFVERIGGEAVIVKTLVRPGQSPETYAPSPAQLVDLAKADLFLGIGVPVEQSILTKIRESMPRLSAHILLAEWKPVIDHATHEHAADGSCLHDHGGSDPHIWMDPLAMIEMSRQINLVLKQASPASSDAIEANTAALIADLVSLDRQLTEAFKPFSGRSFFINHPSLGHFAARYGLRQRSIEQAGSAPSARRIAELITESKKEQVGAIFTQPEFGRSTASILARALRVEVVEVDPLAPDYIDSVNRIAESLLGSFKKGEE